MEAYLPNARRLFNTYKTTAERAMAQVPDEALTWEPFSDCNSIAVIVKHLHGNMLSRWRNFLTEDGEKPSRDREAEFDAAGVDRATVLAWWDEGWALVFSELEALTEADLERTVYIRAEPHSVLDAIQRQLTHYAYHVGQIVFLAKCYRGTDWQSLTIPRGGSKAFNEGMFAKK